MTVCDVTPEMTATMKEAHRRSGFDYIFPRDFHTPIFPVKRAVLDAQGRPIAAAALKVEAEAYLWVDSRSCGPQMRWDAIKTLQADLARKAYVLGFDSAYCVVPPEIAERFGRRLIELGWQATRPWPHYSFQLR